MNDKIKKFLTLTNFYNLASKQLNDMVDGDGSNSLMKLHFKRYFKMDELENDIIPLYLEKFNESDLDQIIDFLESPAGQIMISINNEISPYINDIINKWFTEKYKNAIKDL